MKPSRFIKNASHLPLVIGVILLMAPLASYAAPEPSLTLAVPSEIFIGNAFSFTATFDNTSPTDVGYGPFIDIVFPIIGADGAGAAVDDGIDFVSAAYLGAPVTSVQQTFGPANTGGCTGGLGPVRHPYAVDNTNTPLLVCGTPGNKLVTLQLPFGSFTNDQPPAAITINANLSNLADLGTPLTIRGRAGFQYGSDALNNPATDPSLLSTLNTNSGTWTPASSTTPTLITLTKAYSGPENETATGPNFPRRYTLTATVASGQTVTNLALTDTLPSNLQFLSVISAIPIGGNCGTLPSTSTPGGTLTCTFPSVTNTATVVFEYYIPLLDASNIPVIDPLTGDDVFSQNNARAVGDWTPIDTRDAGGVGNAMADPPGFEHVLTDKSIAIQKSVANVTDGVNSPGDVLEYILTFQVSDYFAFQNVVISDVISDGQRLDLSFPPTLQVDGNGYSLSDLVMSPANYTVDTAQIGNNPDPATNGSTTVTFRVSDEIFNPRGQDSRLIGGCINPATGSNIPDCTLYNNGSTTAVIKFRTIIQQAYSDTYPSGDPSVDQGDTLNNTTIVDGNILDTGTFVPTGNTENDDSGAGVTIAKGTLSKSIYAQNGVPCGGSCSNLQVAPGDTVTYRIQYTLPNSDFEDLRFDDYLPLPIFQATSVTVFAGVCAGAAPPAAGQACLGLNDTYHTLSGAVTPTLSTNGTANRVSFAYGDYDLDPEAASVIDLLFTVTVSNAPFADGLFLTNQVRSFEGTTQLGSQVADNIVQIQLTEPVLSIKKGVVATDKVGAVFSPATVGPVAFDAPGTNLGNPGNFTGTVTSNGLAATPVNSNLAGIDAGDLVKFAIVVENTGSGLNGAFDMRVKDTIPTGFSYPGSGLNLKVTDGTGAAIAYTDLGGGLFGTGLELTDPGPTATPAGALDPYNPTSGRNILIITYDLRADGPADTNPVTPRQVLTNTATLFNYAGAEGGADHTSADLTDAATVTIASPAITKTILSVVPGPTAPNATIGDTITYSLNVTLPEGRTPGLVLTDTLPAGYQFVLGSVTVVPGTFAGTVTGSPGVGVAGQVITITLDNVDVTADNNSGSNSFAVTLQALVIDNPANAATGLPQTKTNQVRLTYTGNPGGPLTASRNNQFLEPRLTVSKGMAPANPDAGNTVTVTLTVSNTGTAPAYDVTVTDNLSLMTPETPFDLTPISSINIAANQGIFTCGYSNPVVTCTASPLTTGASGTITFTAVVKPTVVTGSVYTNNVSISGDGQSGTPPLQRSTTNSGSANISSASTAVTKQISATSEPDTSGSNVAIGEVVTYRVAFTLPEGVTRSVILADLLSANMTYLNGTARVQKTTLALTCNDPGADCASINGAAVGALVPDTLTYDGVTLEWRLSLGNVTNAASDGAAEQYILDLQSVVNNSVTANAGTLLNNRGRIRYDNIGGTPQMVETADIPATVVEPAITIVKTANPGAAAGGDMVTYTLVVTNTSGSNRAPAYDLLITDPLPADVQSPAITCPGAGCNAGTTGAALTASFTGNTLNATIDKLDPNESVTFTYTAVLDPAVAFGKTINNTAVYTATSLPGTNGTGSITPGAPGTGTGERTGAGGVNDLTGSDPAAVTVNTPTLTKTVVGLKSFYPIGDAAIYRLTLPVPVGTTTNFVLTDIIPADLTYSNGSLAVTIPAGASAGNTPLADSNGSFFSLAGQTMTLNFGTLTVPTTGNITVEFSVTVQNVLANQDNRAFTNSATLTFDDPAGGSIIIGPATNNQVRAGEPNLELSKAVTAGAVGSDAGDTVSWRVVLQNTGHTTAYQVDWRDILPDGLNRISQVVITPAGNVYLNGTTTLVGSGDAQITSTTNQDDTLALPLFQIDPGASLTIHYDSRVMDTVIPGQVLNNVTDVVYTSLAGGGRNGSDGGDDDVNDRLNNYREQASQSLTIGAPIALNKSVNPAVYTIGQDLEYLIRVSLIEGTTPDLSLTDVLPAGLTYRAHSISVGNMGMVIGNPGYNNRLGTGQIVEFNLGSVTNPANGSTADDYLDVRITARVENIAANQDGTILRNGEQAEGSELYVRYGVGPQQVVFDYDAGTPGNQGVPITLVEPVLAVTKTANPVTQSLGDLVTFTVQVQHSGVSTATAYDLVINDTLPAGLTYVPGSATLPGGDVTVNGQQLQFRYASITLAEGGKAFSYQARVDLTAPVGQTLVNPAALTWVSLPGSTGGADSGRNGSGGINDYSAAASAQVVVNEQASINAVKTVVDLNGGFVLPGDTLEYTVSIQNTNGPLTGVVFTDPIPADTTYVPGSVTSTKGTASQAGNSITAQIGNLAPGESVTLTFRVTINPGTPPFAVISNQGTVNSDQTVPRPTDWDNNTLNGYQPTDVIVGGTPQETPGLYATKTARLLTDADSSGSNSVGDTMRYTVTLRNVGAVDLTNGTVTDVIPTGLAYVDGSAVISGGGTVTVTPPDLSASVPVITGGGLAVLEFDVIIVNPGLFINQGTANADQTEPTPTDSDGVRENGFQPTEFSAVPTGGLGIPDLVLEKTAVLVGDLNGDGLVNPGETLEYILIMQNRGSREATDVRLNDPVPVRTSLVAGTVTTSLGVVVSEIPVAINVGTVSPGQVVTVRFRVRIDPDTPQGTFVVNTATLTQAGFSPIQGQESTLVVSAPTAIGFLCGSIFKDCDEDGTRDPLERGLSGITVYLLHENGTWLASATTNFLGVYKFNTVPVGAYTVQEIVPSGYTAAGPTALPVSIAEGQTAHASFALRVCDGCIKKIYLPLILN